MPKKNDLPRMAITHDEKLAVHYRPRNSRDADPWVHEHTGRRFGHWQVEEKPRQAKVTNFREIKKYGQ